MANNILQGIGASIGIMGHGGGGGAGAQAIGHINVVPNPIMGGGGVFPTHDMVTDTITDEYRIAIRMGWDNGNRFGMLPSGVQRMIAQRVSATLVVVLLVFKETYTVIEDDAGMFPSDALVTKLRLLTAG